MPETVDTERELFDRDAQTLSAAENRSRALAGIQREWDRAWEENAFYQHRYKAAGLDAGSVPDLDDIPRTTKNDLRADVEAHPPFGTHRTVTLESARRVGTSTGTTGKPWLVLWTPRDMAAAIEVRLQYLWRVGMRPGGRFAHSWPTGLYSTGILAGRDFLLADIMEIPCGLPATPEDVAFHLELWQLLKPTGYMLSGSQLQIYEAAAAAAGIDLRSVMEGASLLFVDAACQFPGPRARIEEAYGVHLHNISGASEVPAFSVSDCKYHTGLHVPMGHHLIQIVDPVTGRELPDGERGSLVINSYDLDAFYLRYDLEDIVVASTVECPCGETGQRYSFVGRGADGAVVEGKWIFPIDVQVGLFELGGPEFQLRPGEGSALELKVEADGAGEAARFEGALAESIGVPVRVEAVAVNSLPRSTFKPRRISS
jgi:phenylacetate-CoA ligase